MQNVFLIIGFDDSFINKGYGLKKNNSFHHKILTDNNFNFRSIYLSSSQANNNSMEIILNTIFLNESYLMEFVILLHDLHIHFDYKNFQECKKVSNNITTNM